jgi:hypothetical protein
MVVEMLFKRLALGRGENLVITSLEVDHILLLIQNGLGFLIYRPVMRILPKTPPQAAGRLHELKKLCNEFPVCYFSF